MAATAFDWDAASRDWDDPIPVPTVAPSAIRRRVARDSAILWITIAGEVLLVVQLAALTRSILASDRTPYWIAWVLINWILLAGISIFAFRNRRGLFRAADAAPDAYIDLTRRRLRARIRTALAIRVITGIQVFVALPALIGVQAIAGDAETSWPAILVPSAMSAAVAILLAAGSVVWERRVRRESDAFEGLLY